MIVLMQFRPFILPLFLFCFGSSSTAGQSIRNEVINTLEAHILREADWALQQQPITITAYGSPRSAGSIHDFYSEGDYWWPDSTTVDGPYVQRDGLTNPDNFTAHRLAMIRFSKVIGSLASAYLISNDERYAKHAVLHLNAWFVSPNTRMNPNLLYAQAISGRVTGRGIGIIDTIHLMEVAQGALVLGKSSAFPQPIQKQVKIWFTRYLEWLTTHEYGMAEMNAKNNHGTCWVMQVAAFANLTGDKNLLKFCSERFKNVLLPDQMDGEGKFPLELGRSKPYGYSIFNLDAMTMIAQILSDSENNLWLYETQDGKSIRKGIEFLYPFIKDKSTWPYGEDVMYWRNWPVAPPFLVFGADAYKHNDWLATWKKLEHNPGTEEVVRNLPIRNPLIWIN